MNRILRKCDDVSVDKCVVFNGNFNELSSCSIILVWFVYMILSKMDMQDSFVGKWGITNLTKLL